MLETAAEKAHKLHDTKLNHLHVGSVQVDECFTRVRVRQCNATNDFEGDQYAFLGMCRESKLIIGYHVGKRTEEAGFAIMDELNKRIHGRFQLTSDAFRPFRKAALTMLSNRADYYDDWESTSAFAARVTSSVIPPNIASFTIDAGSLQRSPNPATDSRGNPITDLGYTAELTTGQLADWMPFKAQRISLSVNATITYRQGEVKPIVLMREPFQSLSPDDYVRRKCLRSDRSKLSVRRLKRDLEIR